MRPVISWQMQRAGIDTKAVRHESRAGSGQMRIKILSALVALLIALACTEWHTSPRSASGSYPPDKIPRAKVTVLDGTSLELVDARVRTDSIVGTDPTSSGRVAIPTNRISRIESLEFSQSRTFGLFASLGIAFVAASLYLVAHNK